jgi:hypothetical protein
MGGSSSKSTIQKLTDIATNVMNKSVQRCVTSATQNQMMDIDNEGGFAFMTGVTQKQGVSIDASCVESADTQTQIQNDLASQISAAVNSKTGDFTSGASKSVSNVDIKNILSTNINNDTLHESINEAIQRQGIKVHNKGGTLIMLGVSQEQGASMYVQAMLSSDQYSAALNKIAEKIDVSATSESKGIFSSLFDMLGSMFNSWTMMVAGIVLVVILLIFFTLRMFGGSAASVAASPEVQGAAAKYVAQTLQKGGGIMRKILRYSRM